MKIHLLLISTVLSLLGCASSLDALPQAQKLPTLSQYKFKSSSHWNLIAKDVADQVATRLSKQELKQPIFFAEEERSSSFERDFRQMLLSALVDKGLSVSTVNQNVNILKIKTSINHHAGSYQPGTLTALASTLLVVRELTHQSHISGAEGLALAAATDFAVSNKNTPPEFELTVMTSIEDERLYKFATTDVYYIFDEDLSNYRKPVVKDPVGRDFKVMGEGL